MLAKSLLVALLIVFAGNAFGQADKLKDLVGARASSAETEIENRGYISTSGTKDDTGSWTYWWNAKEKKCVSVYTEDGRYKSITDTTAPDCGQKTGLSSSDKAAIAVGAAAAAIGVAAIVHKAHDHDDDKHWDNDRWESEYERGYRDGLYNNSYHDWNDSKQYKDGYRSGVKQRRRETPYSSGYGGYAPHVYIQDLWGKNAAGADSELRSRGFRDVNTQKFGNASYVIWFNAPTGQCVRVITIDGKVNSTSETTSPYCR